METRDYILLVGKRERDKVRDAIKKLVLDPDLDLALLTKGLKARNMLEHLYKAQVFLKALEIGQTYTVNQLRDIAAEAGFKLQRPGTTLTRLYRVNYYPKTKEQAAGENSYYLVSFI